MHHSDDPFNRNPDFSMFLANFLAMRQRDQAMRQRDTIIEELAARNSQLERAARRERLEQKRRDTLYEIDQTAQLIQSDYGDDPEQALYEAAMLHCKVIESELDHSWFTELEWKERCTATLRRVSQLIKHAMSQLTSSQIQAISVKVKQQLAANRAQAVERTKLPCRGCGALILPETAERTGGRCVPCGDKRDAVFGCLMLTAVFVVIPLICAYVFFK